MSSDIAQKGIDLIKDAIQHDENGNYEIAIEKYAAGLECFKEQLKHEKREENRQRLKDKFSEFLERAEYLKRLLKLNKPRETPTIRKESFKQPAGSSSKDQFDISVKKDIAPEAVMSVVPVEESRVKFDDVIGLEDAKGILTETVVMPIKCPQLFDGKIRPQVGILLYGPPGVGKTLLAKALANEAGSYLSNHFTSEIVTQLYGQSKKFVSEMFENARSNAPAILFLQDIDKLRVCDRIDISAESAIHQLVDEMQLLQASRNSHVLVIGETSRPDKMDLSVRSLFPTPVYIPLPAARARMQLFKRQLGTTAHRLSESDFQILAELTEGFTPYDITVIVKEALMQQVRFVRQATHFRRISVKGSSNYVPCAPSAPNAVKRTWQYFADNSLGDRVSPAPLSSSQLATVLQQFKPTLKRSDIEIYERFKQQFGG